MVKHKLTDAKVKGLKEPGIYADGSGLYVRLHPTGSKSWFFIYSRNGIRRELGLGGLEGTAPVSLAVARRKADELRQMLADDRDPYAERAVKKSKAATFKDAAERFLETKSKLAPHTMKEWRVHLFEHAASIGKVGISAINTELIESVLLPLWQTKPATGQRVRSKLENVLDFATAKKMRSGDNPARWSNHLEHILEPASRVTGDNHAAMAFADVPAFMKLLGDDAVERCLRLVILAALRSGEARLAEWSEFDLQAKTWTIPGSRTKTGKELVVPLTDAMIATLGDPGEGFVFPGARKGRPFGNNAMWQVATEKAKNATPHGFRAAFKSWSKEMTDYPNEIAEISMGHSVGNAVERAYRRTDLVEKRRSLMQDWSNYCCPS